MYNIPQHNLRNEALMLRDFHINSSYGRLGKHPPQGRWEGYVENFQYNQALGAKTQHSPAVLSLIRGWARVGEALDHTAR
jgi:hypothetical protein